MDAVGTLNHSRTVVLTSKTKPKHFEDNEYVAQTSNTKFMFIFTVGTFYV